MAAKFLILIACLALAHSAVHKRETAQLDELEKRADEIKKTLSGQLDKLLSSQNTQQTQAALKQGTDSVLQQLSSLSATLQSALSDANGKAKEALQKTIDNVKKTTDDLRKAHPDVEKQAQAVKDSVNNAITNTLEHTRGLAKDVLNNIDETNKKLEPTVKKAFNDVVENFQQVQAKLHEAANKQ